MNVYLHNIDTLKPRIKKLKRALLLQFGIEIPLGTCRDWVAKSIEWEGWNSLYQAHSKGVVPKFQSTRDRPFPMFTERFIDGELNKLSARVLLASIILDNHKKTLTPKDCGGLAEEVWPKNNPKYNSASTLCVNELNPSFLRDGITIDSPSKELYATFRNTLLLPHIAKYGGVIFCTPSESREVIGCIDEHCESHYVFFGDDNPESVGNYISKKSLVSNIEWDNNQENIARKVLEISLDKIEGEKISPLQRKSFFDELFKDGSESPLKETELIVAANKIFDEGDSKRICAFLTNLDKYTNPFIGNEKATHNLPLSQIYATNKPIVVVANHDDLISLAVVGAIMSSSSSAYKRNSVELMKKVELNAPPKLFVLGYNEEITIPGFGVCSGLFPYLRWSIVFPQDIRTSGERCISSETVIGMSNTANLVRLNKRSVAAKLLRKPHGKWFSYKLSPDVSVDTISDLSMYLSDLGEKEPTLGYVNIILE